MNDAEFEKLIKSRLDEHVDAELGARRPAPPFVPTDDRARPAAPGRRSHRPWVRPLLAAACVLAVAGGVIGIVAAVGGGSSDVAPPARPSSSTTSPSPTTTAAPVRTVTLGGARIALPTGYVARDLAKYEYVGGTGTGWCLTPRSRTGYREPFGCPIQLVAYHPSAHGQLDPDSLGGYYGDPPAYCQPNQAHVRERAAERRFGGRAAAWRYWTYTCTAFGRPRQVRAVYRFEQYEVTTGPAYILLALRESAATRRAMDTITMRSRLPDETTSLPYADKGKIVSLRHTAGGVRLRIARTVGTKVDPSLGEAAYLVPSPVYRHGIRPKIGDVVVVITDGTRVTGFGGD